MNIEIRNKLQKSWATTFIADGSRSILHLCPRSGKTRTSIHVFKIIQESLEKTPKILIAYPDKNIQKSWEDDIKDVKYFGDIEYVTHVSLSKIVSNSYDIIVCDEIHLLSALQITLFKKLINNNSNAAILGLSGTLSEKTEIELRQNLKLSVSCSYTLNQAIVDGLISDYKIHVLKVPLNDSVITNKAKQRTEKQTYRALTWVIENKGQNLFLNLARMKVVHNSIAKIEKTKQLLLKLKDKRVLVFCANNKVAQTLGCKIHTSKINDQEEFLKFIEGVSSHNHLAVCKIGNTGVSFKSLDHIVINAFDSNSENLTQRICRSLILDEKNKVSNIYIISSNEKAEIGWLKKALEFFDPSKIVEIS